MTALIVFWVTRMGRILADLRDRTPTQLALKAAEMTVTSSNAIC